MYYYQPQDAALTASQIKSRVGIDPDTYGSSGLTALRIYPIVDKTQPFNTALYTVATTYTINGANADETYTATAKSSLDQPKLDAVTQLIQQAHGQSLSLIKESGIGFRLFVTLSSMLAGDRPARFASWVTRRQAAVTRLANNITAANNASTIDAINDIVSPAWGSINIVANDNNLVASDFTANTFFSKNLTAASLELYFPQTNKTVAYSSGFAATTDAFTDLDKTVQIRVASNSLVIDELCVSKGTVVSPTAFGYRRHQSNSSAAYSSGIPSGY